MAVCKQCGIIQDSFREERKGQHLGEYCNECGAWQKWKKQDKPIDTSEPATDKQREFIRSLLKKQVLIKNQASQIIHALGGDSIGS